jgi:hypothetical protein
MAATAVRCFAIVAMCRYLHPSLLDVGNGVFQQGAGGVAPVGGAGYGATRM